MRNVASLELSKQLFEVSGWETEDWYTTEPSVSLVVKTVPKYDRGFLLRKLPYLVKLNDARGSFQLFMLKLSNGYYIGYNKPETGKWLDCF